MIGKIIKFMRLQSGYKQAEIAKLIKLNQNTVSDYERGNIQPSYETVVRIADICDFEIAFIDKNNGERITQEMINKME